MKTKINLTLLTLGLFIMVWFTNSKLTEEQLEPKPLVALNFVKCTAPKYLLTADTTKQISPLFNNLGVILILTLVQLMKELRHFLIKA